MSQHTDIIKYCREGNLDQVIALHTEYKLDMYRLFYEACVNNHVDILDFLYEASKHNCEALGRYNNFLFKISCQNGHLNIVKYIHTKTNMISEVDIYDSIINTCYNGHKDVLEYLLNNITKKYYNRGLIRKLLTISSEKSHDNITLMLKALL